MFNSSTKTITKLWVTFYRFLNLRKQFKRNETMMKVLTERFAIKGLLTILFLFVIFHLLVMLRIIPFETVWGGRLKDQSQMLTFETVSMIINLIMLATVGIKAEFLKVNINRIIIQIALWIMFCLFLINTIGNFFSNNEFEKLLFTPLTFILSIFSLRIAISKNKKITD